MGSLATFKSTYLTPASPVLTNGARGQLAGPVYVIDRLVADGNSYANAAAIASVKHNVDVVYDAQRTSSPYQANLVADFLAISAA